MTKEEILKLFIETGALLEGHFELTSGLHSPQYFQCAKILQYPRYAELLCRGIVEQFSSQKIDVVASPALGGVVVGQEVARQLGSRSIFGERESGSLQFRRGFEIRPGERVLVCEDVVTTGGSIGELIEIIKKLGGSIVGVGCIVDRSNGKARSVHGDTLFSLVAIDVETYKPEACPLCKQGISVLKPGSRKA